MTAELNYFDREYNSTRSKVVRNKTLTNDSEDGLFVEYEKLNNSLRYCNGCYYKFVDPDMQAKHLVWVKSLSHSRSFELYYGGGIVD